MRKYHALHFYGDACNERNGIFKANNQPVACKSGVMLLARIKLGQAGPAHEGGGQLEKCMR